MVKSTPVSAIMSDFIFHHEICSHENVPSQASAYCDSVFLLAPRSKLNGSKKVNI